MSYINYENIENPTKKYDCELTLLKSDLDTSLYNPLIEVIGKLNLIGNYIKNNEDSWSSEGLSEGGDTLEFPLSAINGLQTSSTNKILYYNNDGDWEYKDYKELKFPLSELYDLTSDNLDGTKWVLVYDLETLNDRGWKFLPYNTGTGSGLILGKVAYDLNTVNNPNTNVKQILVWDNDGNGTWKWLIENYTSTSPTTGLTWTDLTNPGLNKIDKSHMPSLTWWGHGIPSNSNTTINGNLEGNIEYIKFEIGTGSNYKSVYLGIDSDGNLRVSKSSNGNDGSSGANFYATGGVSALGNSSSSSGGGTPGETSLKSLLNNVNDLGTNYTNPSTGYTIVYNNGSWIDRKLDLSELGDVLVNNINTNDVLTYDGTNWINSPSSLGLLSDVDDTVSDIKTLNVIQPSGSILSYSYPLTLLVGSTSETSSNIYNSEVEWKLYVFLLETDSTAAHLIGGGSLTSNMGIVTRLNFGQAGSPMNNYRFPTYITGVRLQSSNMTRYHITGAKHIKDKTINNNNQTWDLDYDETFCSDKVYIINDELYSNAFKVLTTNNLNAIGLSGKNYAISSSNGKLYVNVPWTDNDHTYEGGNGITVGSSPSQSGNYPISVVLTDGGGLAFDNSGKLKISNTYGGTKYLFGNPYWQNGLPQSYGYDNSHLTDINYVTNIYLQSSSTAAATTLTMRDPGVTDDTGSFVIRKSSTYAEIYNRKSSEPLLVTPGSYMAVGQGSIPSTTIANYINGCMLWSNGSLVVGTSVTDTTSSITLGGAVLKWDETNKALYIQRKDGSAANFYATGGVSALGFSNGTSSVDAMTFGNLTVTTNLNTKKITTSDGNIVVNNSGIKLDGTNSDQFIDLDENSYIRFTCEDQGTDIKIILKSDTDGLYIKVGNGSYKKILTAS